MANTNTLEPNTALPPSCGPIGVYGWIQSHAGLAAVLLFAIGFLSPMLRSGFYFDDVKNSCIGGYLRLYDTSLATLVEQCTLGMMQTGRLFPGALAVTYTVHYLLPGAVAYKSFILALTLVNLVQFYVLLRGWKLHPTAAQLAALALVLLMQMRAFGDPLLGFAGIMQVVAGQLLLSMICLQRYLASNRLAWLAASVVIYVSSLLTYEISYLFLPVYLTMALIHNRDWRRGLATAGPYALTAGVLTCYVLGLRYSVQMPQDYPYRFSLSSSAVAETTLKQASAALPLSYALLSPHRPQYFDPWRVVSRWENWAVAITAAVLAGILLRKLARSRAPRQEPSLWLLFPVGLMIWVLPGLAISASPKYQSCVLTGIGYLPVYVQYYGIPLIGLACLLALTRWLPALRAPLACAAIPAIALVSLITFDTNRYVVDVFPSTANCAGQQLAEAAFTAGLADEVPPNSTVIATKAGRIDLLDEGAPVGSTFLTQNLRRKVYSISEVGGVTARSLHDQLASLPSPSYLLSVHAMSPQSGFVILGSLDQSPGAPPIEDANLARSSVRSFRVFMRGPSQEPVDQQAAAELNHWQVGDSSQRDGHAGPRIEASQWKLLRSGPGWAIYEGTVGAPGDVARVEVPTEQG